MNIKILVDWCPSCSIRPDLVGEAQNKEIFEITSKYCDKHQGKWLKNGEKPPVMTYKLINDGIEND